MLPISLDFQVLLVPSVFSSDHVLANLLCKRLFQKRNPVFHCRFWRFGVWNDVYIDDFLPIVHGESIMGAHSATDKNEMWVSLLEKAFAK
jgi:hypothetical protein